MLQLKPDFEAALYERGTALAQQGRIADWFAAFHEFSQHWNGAGAWSPAQDMAHKARHDAEQAAWQVAAGHHARAAPHRRRRAAGWPRHQSRQRGRGDARLAAATIRRS